MGEQSILIKKLENYQEEFDEKLLKLGDNYTLKRRFMIGEGVDYERMMHTKTFYKLLCTDNCELIDWIDKKIKGKLKDCKVKIKKRPTISDLFKLYQQKIKACSITKACGDCGWEEIQW